jgi:hypothetical protein
LPGVTGDPQPQPGHAAVDKHEAHGCGIVDPDCHIAVYRLRRELVDGQLVAYPQPRPALAQALGGELLDPPVIGIGHVHHACGANNQRRGSSTRPGGGRRAEQALGRAPPDHSAPFGS